MPDIDVKDLQAAIREALGPVLAEIVAKEVASNAKPGVDPEKTIAEIGSKVGRRKFDYTNPENKGIGAARYVRCLAGGRGDLGRAADFCKRMYNDDLGDEVHKALLAGSLEDGGALVPPEYSAELIELLRAKTVVRAAGARTIPMPGGTITLRKQTAGSTASYVGESRDIGVTGQKTGLLTLSSKKLAALVPISNDLLKFSSGPTADAFVRDDLVAEISIREDRAFLRDDGTQFTPKGMRFWAVAANITASNGTTATDIEDDFKELINALEGNNVAMTRCAWFMHPSRKNHLRNLRDANGNLIYPEVRTANPNIYGYPIFTSTSVPANLGGGAESEILLADMADMLIGEASGLEIVASSEAAYVEDAVTKSAFSLDETLIRAITRHDFAARHDVSIAVKTTVAWGPQ